MAIYKVSSYWKTNQSSEKCTYSKSQAKNSAASNLIDHEL